MKLPSNHQRSHMVTYAIKDKSSSNTVTWNETIQVNDKPVLFRIDTGSDVNLISQDIFKKLKPRLKLSPSSAKLSSYSGHTIKILGVSELKCTKNGKQHTLKFFITDFSSSENVLGLQACLDFEIVVKVPTPVEVNSAERIIKLFSDVFDPLEIIRWKPWHINLHPQTKHQNINKKVVVARDQNSKLKLELQRMVDCGILEVAEDDKTNWFHPAIVTPQSNDTIMVSLDLRLLQKHLITEEYLLPIIDTSSLNIKDSQYFSLLTTPNAHTQLPLNESSCRICTFSTSYGKYRFKTIPYGFAKAPQLYHTIATEIFDKIEGVWVFVEQILIHGQTKDEHNNRLMQVLERARKYNLKFAKIKLQLAKTEIKFAGYTLSKNAITLDPSRVEAIKPMAVPTNKLELQRFLDIIETVAPLIPNISIYRQPLVKILDKSEKFVWSKDQDGAFCILKNLLCELPALKCFNPNKSVYFSLAASTHGFGCVVLQDCHPLGYYSTTFNNLQQKYTQIEKKLLAILLGLEHFHYYTYGKEVIIQSDHRPLLTLLKESIDILSPRVQKIMVKLMKYQFKWQYVAGKDLVFPYALSRNPLKPKNINEAHYEVPTIPSHTLLSASDERIQYFKQSLKEDAILQHVLNYIKEGWPKYPSWIKTDAKKYSAIKDELHYTGDLLFYGNKLVVPQKERQKVLKQLHTAHQSVKSTQQKAKLVYYWPTMSTDIETFVTSCLICQRYSKTTINSVACFEDLPELPWIKLGISFVHLDRKDFVVVVDYFSNFLLVKPVNVKTAKVSIGALEDCFSVHGLPLEVVTINAPPFNTLEWKVFLKTYDIKVTTYTEANPDGFLSKHVQIAKSLVRRSINSSMALFVALLEYNSSPKHYLPSPSELLMGRRLRTSLLMPKTMLIPNYDISKVLVAMKKNQEVRNKENNNYGADDGKLPELKKK